ncbi:MAG: energy transducer TonB [Chitinophagales bacterium]
MNNYQKLSMDEIIFENRNKNYGAYELRQTIDRNSTIGLLVTTTAFILFMLLYKLSAFGKQEIVTTTTYCPTIEVQELNVDVPKPKIEVQQIPPPLANASKLVDFKVVEDKAITKPETLNAQDDLVDKNIGEKEITNAPESTPAPPSEVLAMNGRGDVPVEAPAPKPAIVVSTTILNTSQVPPSFPNGNAALMKYLRDNIRPYDSDIETGNSGKVTIRFYVDVDGTVRSPEVMKDGIGGRCAEAAIYAIKKMPKWNPGLQNGTPVKVYFTLPVSFDFSHN